jgi:uncharacterized RDD family membrane protein YckC
MAASSTQRDPRSVVTPDAFDVSSDLLGMPLARPSRRLIAILIDLAVIGIVTAVTTSFALVLGVVAAIFFVRAGFKRTPVRGSVFGRAMRFSVGCLGLFIAAVTAVLWTSFGPDFGRGNDTGPTFNVGVGDNVSVSSGSFLGAVASAATGVALANAEDIEEAEEAAVGLIQNAEELGIDRSDLSSILLELVPEDAEWADDAEELFSRLLGEEVEPGPRDEEALRLEVEVAAYTDAEALDAYARLLEASGPDAASEARQSALRARLGSVVAGDSLSALQDRVQALDAARLRSEAELERTENALEEATQGGLFAWLRNFVDELGFGFGWASLYLTVFLSWWKGQTIGKRVMGLRVVRLDGEPITWWVAFERAGGYAAGFATGLLGFAQVYWDSNRQAIHDRIVGTVVVREGAERVSDWETTL